MQSDSAPARLWLVLGFSFTCGLACLLLAGILILQALIGHGSQPGNILRVGLAIFALFLGCLFFVLGALYHASFTNGREH